MYTCILDTEKSWGTYPLVSPNGYSFIYIFINYIIHPYFVSYYRALIISIILFILAKKNYIKNFTKF